MYTGADQRLKNLSHLNQYNNEEELVAEPGQAPNHTLFDSNSTKLLYMDGKSITEDEYAKLKKNQTSSPFVKNDFTRGVYPLKINEYLAVGLPVVSTRFSVIEGLTTL